MHVLTLTDDEAEVLRAVLENFEAQPHIMHTLASINRRIMQKDVVRPEIRLCIPEDPDTIEIQYSSKPPPYIDNAALLLSNAEAAALWLDLGVFLRTGGMPRVRV